MKTQILALASPRAHGSLSLQQILERLRDLPPPPKSAALVAAEARIAEAQARFEAADARYKAIIQACNVETLASRDLPISRGAFAQLEAERGALQLDLSRALEEGADLALQWRQEFCDAICAAALPARAALHAILGDLSAAMEIFGQVAARATDQRIGVPWLLRNAETTLRHLAYFREVLQTDKEIVP